jgi:nucleoside-diphosphate-sugar epimerase
VRFIIKVQFGLLIHIAEASDVSFNSNPEEVVPWVTQAIHNVLETASKNCDIKRVVLTSSAVAALFPEPNKEGIVVREGESWNLECTVVKSNGHGSEEQLG